MTDNVTQFPKPEGPPDFLIGPFTEHRVVIEGRCIPNLTAFYEGDDIALVVDHRFSVSLPKSRAYDVAWLIANAMAVAAGYPWLGAENKDRPFAPQCAELDALPPKG